MARTKRLSAAAKAAHTKRYNRRRHEMSEAAIPPSSQPSSSTSVPKSISSSSTCKTRLQSTMKEFNATPGISTRPTELHVSDMAVRHGHCRRLYLTRTDNKILYQSGLVQLNVATFKLLGINLGASLSWSLHVNTISAKASICLFILK